MNEIDELALGLQLLSTRLGQRVDVSIVEDLVIVVLQDASYVCDPVPMEGVLQPEEEAALARWRWQRSHHPDQDMVQWIWSTE